jgi:hypothetical protein
MPNEESILELPVQWRCYVNHPIEVLQTSRFSLTCRFDLRKICP